jgi:hypothetical protein
MPANARTGRTLSSHGMGLSRRTKLGSKCRRFRWWDQSGTDGRRAADDEAHKLGTCTLKGSELIARIRREKRICFRSCIVSALTSHVNDIAASVPLCDLVDLLLNFNSTFCANGDCQAKYLSAHHVPLEAYSQYSPPTGPKSISVDLVNVNPSPLLL